MHTISAVWLTLVFVWLFAVGCAVGSFLNVCIYRVPRGKNLFWPPSRCGACLSPIAARDNIPLLSYWLLRGRCRVCGAPFSMRYFWVELLTGVVFALLFLLEVGLNLHGYPDWAAGGLWLLEAGRFPPWSLALVVGHGVLASFLLVAAGCLIEVGRLPRALAVCGAVAGLAWSLLFPWPEPVTPVAEAVGDTPVLRGEGWPRRGPMPAGASWAAAEHSPQPGFVPWPVWGPLPPPLPPGSFALGLATGLTGILLVPWLLRLADLVRESLGRRRLLGEAAGVLALAGGFLGWQPAVVALALALLLAPVLSPGGGASGPRFALLLVGAVVLAWLGWPWLGPACRLWLFSPGWLACALAALFAGLLLLGRSVTPPAAAAPPAAG